MSEIERYLDELFDKLAGTGAAGRRALTEAEYHLRAVAVGAMARGLPEDQAEHEAVSRFGPPALVARKLRSAGHLNRAVSTAWLPADLAACGAQKQPDVRWYFLFPRYRPPLFFACCSGYVSRDASPETSSTLVLLLEGDPQHPGWRRRSSMAASCPTRCLRAARTTKNSPTTFNSWDRPRISAKPARA